MSFVDGSALHFALREMLSLMRSVRLWLTFAAVVALFSVTAPYGTDRLGPLPRSAFWLLLLAATWAVAIVFAVGGDSLLRSRLGSRFVRMMIGSLAAAFPIGLIVTVFRAAWFGAPFTLGRTLGEAMDALPLCAVFCGLSYLALSGEKDFALSDRPAGAMPAPFPSLPDSTTSAAGDRTGTAPPPLLARLSPANRGRLLHISVEDHYSKVRTTSGSELILLRFSDAIGETAPCDGLQVHRSHWVALDFVAALRQTNGRPVLALRDGSEVPVSRTYLAAVRQRLLRTPGEDSLQS
jgi:DNA-binding LytR/AlgR family response regulator